MSASMLVQRMATKPVGAYGYFSLADDKEALFHALKTAGFSYEKISAAKGIGPLSFALSSNDLFGAPPMLIIDEVESLPAKQIDALESMLKGASRRILVLSSKASSALKRLFSSFEMSLSLLDEKPWQKRARRKTWVQSELSRQGLKFTSEAMEAFLDLSENDLTLTQEMAKLKAYSGKKGEIGLKELNLLCQKESEDSGWKAFEYVCSRNWKALATLGEAFSKDSGTLSSLLMQLRFSCMQALEVKEEGGGEHFLKLRPNLSPWRVKKILEQTKNASFETLSKSARLTLELEVMQRTSKLEPRQMWDLTFASLQKLFS
jgi:DNA polymerase III delta subunit